MPRLIDADKLVAEIAKHYSQPNYHPDADAFMALKVEKHNEYIHSFMEEVESQPTAYDVDKVVEQLKTLTGKNPCEDGMCPYLENEKITCENCYMVKAVTIVKGAINNDRSN
jgi:hypothetical protein